MTPMIVTMLYFQYLPLLLMFLVWCLSSTMSPINPAVTTRISTDAVKSAEASLSAVPGAKKYVAITIVMPITNVMASGMYLLITRLIADPSYNTRKSFSALMPAAVIITPKRINAIVVILEKSAPHKEPIWVGSLDKYAPAAINSSPIRA